VTDDLSSVDKLAEEIYEHVCANTPDGKDASGAPKLPWPHSPFATLSESAKEHYRHCARFCLDWSIQTHVLRV